MRRDKSLTVVSADLLRWSGINMTAGAVDGMYQPSLSQQGVKSSTRTFFFLIYWNKSEKYWKSTDSTHVHEAQTDCCGKNDKWWLSTPTQIDPFEQLSIAKFGLSHRFDWLLEPLLGKEF